MTKLADVKNFVVDVMPLGVVNANGRMYPKEVMADALERYRKERGDKMLGAVVAGLFPPKDVSLAEAAFEARPFIEGDMLKAEIEVLDTPAGRSLGGYVNVDGPSDLRGATAGTGETDLDGVLREGFQLTHIGLVRSEDWGARPADKK